MSNKLSVVVPAAFHSLYEIEIRRNTTNPTVVNPTWYRIICRKQWPCADGIYVPAHYDESNHYCVDVINYLRANVTPENLRYVAKEFGW